MSPTVEAADSVQRVDSALTLLRKEALTCRLKHYDPRARCLAWRCFLGLLPTKKGSEGDSGGSPATAGCALTDLPALWRDVASEWRARYEELKREAFVDPRNGSTGPADPAVHNPLSDADESLWKIYWQNEEVKIEIHRDVVRCYPEIEWFQGEEVQGLLLRVLYVHAKQSKLGYRQGMHELLAPIVLMLHRERESAAEAAAAADPSISALLATFADPQYLEHDAFALLDALLARSGEWFESNSAPPAPAPAGAVAAPPTPSPIIRKCRYIQDALLCKFDTPLYDHLTAISIEPQLYLLRWLRLLFGREFHVEDALIVWDAVFAYDDRLGLVDYFCTAMLMFIRTQLLGRDYTSCIRRLLKFPPIEDISVLVEHALALTKPKPPPGSAGSSSVVRRVVPTPTTLNHTPAKPSPAHGHSVRPTAPVAVDATSARIEELELRHSILATRLQKVIDGLQVEVQSGQPVSDAVILAVAELKQVKDLAFGFLDPSQLLEVVESADVQVAVLPAPASFAYLAPSAAASLPPPSIKPTNNTAQRARPAPEALKIGEGVVDDIFS